MRAGGMLLGIVLLLCFGATAFAAAPKPSGTHRLLVISSYHREYVWSQDTAKGFCAAMLAFGYFENDAQAAEFIRNDFVTTSHAIVKKMWMNAKRRGSKAELEEAAQTVYKAAQEFKPDLIFLGDDEAGEYIGTRYLDTKTPVVFWGFNDYPVKYGLLDTAARPGHNVTGVYQSGYYIETLQVLRALVPGVKTFAVLSDETVSGRTHYKAINHLARNGELPLTLLETVATGEYEAWKTKVQELQKKADAFYVVSLAGLKDAQGNGVPISEVATWYLTHVTIPEATRGHYVKNGLLCAADDSGYKQAYEAVSMAFDILEHKASPATYAARTPSRGALMVNRTRAAALGITLVPGMGIEEYIDSPLK